MNELLIGIGILLALGIVSGAVLALEMLLPDSLLEYAATAWLKREEKSS